MFRGNTVVLLMCYVVLAKTQYEGDGCRKNGVSGTCALLKNCQSAINDIKNKQPPQICTFRGMDPIVCCINFAPPKPPGTTSRPSVLATSTQRPKTTTEYVPPVYDNMFGDPNMKSQGGCEPIASNLTSPRTGQKAWDKCIEYQEKLVYPCVKGNSLAEFPHMALLGFGSDVDALQWHCGGSIISERFILTASHCTHTRDLGPVTYALLGILSRIERVDSSQRYKIKRIIRHPDYKPPKKYNDIALLQTEVDMTLNENIVPACLHVDTTAPDERALASGWGAIQTWGSGADSLQKVVLKKFSDSECAQLFRPARLMENGFDSKTQICYGDKAKSKDNCQGDSGGPLQLKNKKIHCMYTVVGVTSFRKACEYIGEPGIYTKVSAFVPWIESVVWP
ncbi:unnamed protein product [Parnassius apollo]|uniref:(apollo) hypothetical protein n=1 Tax=Parnassius apollo TaxID=110799 RepID=A0A8S3WFI1_PARAO|nr:unnamed protein product [Parnassius apollo]